MKEHLETLTKKLGDIWVDRRNSLYRLYMWETCTLNRQVSNEDRVGKTILKEAKKIEDFPVVVLGVVNLKENINFSSKGVSTRSEDVLLTIHLTD